MITTSTIKSAVAALNSRAQWHAARRKPVPPEIDAPLRELEAELERRRTGEAYRGMQRIEVSDADREALRLIRYTAAQHLELERRLACGDKGRMMSGLALQASRRIPKYERALAVLDRLTGAMP